MLRLYLRLSVLFMFTFAVCGFVLIAFGSTQPIHPALRGFVEGCEGIPQPCWYGIVPGRTTYMEANTILNTMGFKAPLPLMYNNTYTLSIDGCNFEAYIGIEKIIIYGISILPCAGAVTGDAMAVLELYPHRISGDCLGGIALWQASTSITMSEISLESSVERISLVSPAYQFEIDYMGVPWHGFGQYETLGDPGCG